ncbi:aminoglycoside phosphotransferase family protein [Microlunatus sp. Gsoil 973]|uniref:phosphotransferase n=1 Tax=Microlunatus sp. Gsoil 973 TaxID=2672569 RepID=UPI0012B4559E|nr:aminoglycoside phosphotransferase family protein [Microlunatus sp. Gsoil 973]QGN32541.1 phosphotransferase [Microlunatus sp. Gsoil 973]
MTDALEAAGRDEATNRRIRPVAIDGDRVSRPSTPASATIQTFLRFLRSQDMDCVPQPLGLDLGSETLQYIPGASGGDGWYHQHTVEGLASAARLLRRIHDAGQTWDPPADAVWGAPVVQADEVVYCHGDPGPWNFVWNDNRAVGLIDWDYLHPGPRLDDIAYALRWFVPMRSDQLALDWHHFPMVPDRRHRIEVFLQAYGDLPRFDVVEAVASRMMATRDLVHQRAEAGQEPQQTWVRNGALDREDEEIAWVLHHRESLTLNQIGGHAEA